MKPRENVRATRRTRLLTALKYGVGLAALAILIYLADMRSVVAALTDVSLVDVCILAVLSFLLIAVSAIKWQAFLEQLEIKASFWRLFGLYLVGYFVNLLMPSYIGGDIVRSLYIGDREDRSKAVSATVLERYTGLVAMLVIAGIAVWWAPRVTLQMKLLTLTAVVAMTIGSFLVFCRRVSWILARMRAPQRLQVLAERAESDLIAGAHNPALLTRVGLLSLLFHCLTVLNTAAVGWAVGWDNIPWQDLFVVVPLILLVGAVPISPQGLGIQEGAFLYFLHGVGATTGQAISISLILRLKSYILAVVGGVIWMFLKRNYSRGSTTRT